MTFYQGRHRARVFRLYDTRTVGHRPLTTGPSGARHSALLTWIVSRASSVYSEHVCVVRIHPRYRGTPPDEERLEYFSLAPTEKVALEQLHSIKSRIGFILQLGYFKSHHLFFVFDLPNVEADARYIQGQYFPSFQLTDLDITKVTRLKQQGLILVLFNYRLCDAEQRQALAEKARQAAMVSSKPIYVFRELMHYLEDQRVVAPGYSLMQDTIGQALTYEQERLATILVGANLFPC